MFIHLQEGICGNTHKRAKIVQKNKAQIPLYTSPRERGPLPNKSGPEGMKNRAKFQSNHLIFAEHHHGPSQDAQRSSLTKKGHVWAQWWGGRTTPTGPFWPHFWQVASHRCCNNGYIGARPGSTYLKVGLHFP